MPWEAGLNALLQGALSCGFTDGLMLGLTMLGDEIFVIAVMMVMFWCISKKTGFKFINIYFCTVAVNSLLKNLVRRPRPFAAYADEVRSIGSPTGGYSFPSGHTNSITTVGTLFCNEYKKQLKVFLPVAAALVFIVAFTRLYLGQHYLTDVLAAAVIAIALTYALGKAYALLGDKEERLGFVLVPAAIVISVVVSVVSADPSTLGKTLRVTGVMSSLYIGYFVEKRYFRYDVTARLSVQILKCLIGATVAFGIYFGLDLAFAFDGTFWLHGWFRFFLLGAWLTIGAPALFRLLRLEGKKEKELIKNG